MDEIRSFSSLEEMFEFIAVQMDRANATLADEQRAITWGSHWVRFVPEHQLMIFGRVFTREELETSERESGADQEELDYVLRGADDNHERGYLFGRAYSVVEPEGELGDTHRGHMWPITAEQFAEAQEAGWFPAEVPGRFTWLQDAYTGYRTHLINDLE